MKILITGGCGFVGSNLAIYFKNNRIGSKINTLDNLSRKGSFLNLKRLKKNKIKNFKKDISDYNNFVAILNILFKINFFLGYSIIFDPFINLDPKTASICSSLIIML